MFTYGSTVEVLVNGQWVAGVVSAVQSARNVRVKYIVRVGARTVEAYASDLRHVQPVEVR